MASIQGKGQTKMNAETNKNNSYTIENKNDICAIALEIERAGNNLEHVSSLVFNLSKSTLINENGRDCLDAIAELLIDIDNIILDNSLRLNNLLYK